MTQPEHAGARETRGGVARGPAHSDLDARQAVVHVPQHLPIGLSAGKRRRRLVESKALASRSRCGHRNRGR